MVFIIRIDTQTNCWPSRARVFFFIFFPVIVVLRCVSFRHYFLFGVCMLGFCFFYSTPGHFRRVTMRTHYCIQFGRFFLTPYFSLLLLRTIEQAHTAQTNTWIDRLVVILIADSAVSRSHGASPLLLIRFVFHHHEAQKWNKFWMHYY